MEHVIEYVF